jgi:hypothetical protein
MEMIGNKERLLAFVYAVGLMVVGFVGPSSVIAGETEKQIDVEIVPPGEPAERLETANLTRILQNQRKPLQNNRILRGVHPKSHGCVNATFSVLEYIDSAYKFGLFAHGVTYSAIIRYSNASVLLEPDLKDGDNGSRGMAIKVFGLNKNLGLFELEDGDARNQDFLMVNTPEFAFATVRDYLRLTRILTLGKGAGPFFIPLILKNSGLLTVNPDGTLTLNPLQGSEPEQIKSAWEFYKNGPPFKGFNLGDLMKTGDSAAAIKNIKSRTVRNPLEVQYFSAAPFRFGPEQVMKFSVIPAAGAVPQQPFSLEEKAFVDDNYLAQALQESIAKGKTIHLSFMIQTAEKSQLAGRADEMIENAAFTWNEDEFPFVKVAHIVIDPKKQENVEFVNACSSERFTPWHALKAHEPLGGINRLRRPVYCESGEFRPDGMDPTQVLCRAADYN